MSRVTSPSPTRTSTAVTTLHRRRRTMSATERPGATSEQIPVRGLKLPPPEPPKFSLSLKVFLAATLLILVAVGGAIAISAYRARQVADAKIREDLKKSGPAWDSFQATRYA